MCSVYDMCRICADTTHTVCISWFPWVNVRLKTVNLNEVMQSLCDSGTDVYTHMGQASSPRLSSLKVSVTRVKKGAYF